MAQGVSSAGSEAVKFAADHGLILDDWQAQILDDALHERADGKWASYEVGVCCPRQNGKSAVLEALMLWSLFCDDQAELTIYTAHEFKTTREIFRRVDGLIQGFDDLRSLVKRRVSTLVEMGYELDDGSRLAFLARSGSSGRGFSADRTIFDEAMILSGASMLAMIPALSAMPNPQMWFAGSAGLSTSDHWRGVRDRGRAGESQRLTWVEFCAPDDAEIEDRAAWAKANPGYPLRLLDDSIAAELDAVRGDSGTLAGWKRERYGHWDEPAGGGNPIPLGLWVQLADPTSKLTGRPVFSVDVSWDRGNSAIGVAGTRDDGLEHLEVVDYQPGTDWVLGRCVELNRKHRPLAWVVQPGSPAASLTPLLEQAGLSVLQPSARELGEGCGGLFDAITQQTLRHIGQRNLDGALGVAHARRLGEAWVWDRAASPGDISPLVAVTLARWGLVERKPADYDVLSSAW